MCRGGESNTRRQLLQSCALPLSYRGIILYYFIFIDYYNININNFTITMQYSHFKLHKKNLITFSFKISSLHLHYVDDRTNNVSNFI